MGKTLSIAMGALAAFVGLVLLIAWWYEFLFMLRAAVPVLLIAGGLIALFAGFSEFRDTLKSRK